MIAGAGGVVMAIGAFLAWLTTATETGGRTSVSGFGAISGDNPLSGTNLNDVLSTGGLGSFRPGLVALVAGAIAVLAGSAAAMSRPTGRHPFRIAAALLVLAGVAGLAWGLFRGFVPGTGGVLAAGEGAAGAGEWVTAAGGLLALATGCWLLSGRADLRRSDPSTRHHGIQS